MFLFGFYDSCNGQDIDLELLWVLPVFNSFDVVENPVLLWIVQDTVAEIIMDCINGMSFLQKQNQSKN